MKKGIALFSAGLLCGLALNASYIPPRLQGTERGGVVITGERAMEAAVTLAGEHCKVYKKYPVLTEITARTLGQIKFDCIIHTEH